MNARDYRMYRGELGAMAALLQLLVPRKRYGRHAYATHPWWTASEVAAEDVLRVISKLDARYKVLASTRAKHAARAAGVGAATAHAILHPRHLPPERHEAGRIPWVFDLVLVASEPIEPAMRNGRHDATALVWRGKYRLVQRSGRWTWRMTRAERSRLDHVLHDAIVRAGATDAGRGRRLIEEALREVLRAPRYRDIRRDVITILRDARRQLRSEAPALVHLMPTAAAITRASLSGFPRIYEDRADRPHTLGAWIDLQERLLPRPSASLGGAGDYPPAPRLEV